MSDELPNTEFLLPAIVAISAFSPGFIIVFIRNQLLTGRTKTVQQLAAEYGLVSAIYYSCVLGLANFAFATWHSLFLTLFIVPLVIGFVAGIISQNGWLRCILGKLKIRTVHSAPSAWDYIFGFSVGTRWIIVTLKDGSTVKGLFQSSESFASSDLSSRDLFIAEVSDQDFNLPEDDKDKRGIWINESEIRTVEFIGKGKK